MIMSWCCLNQKNVPRKVIGLTRGKNFKVAQAWIIKKLIEEFEKTEACVFSVPLELAPSSSLRNLWLCWRRRSAGGRLYRSSCILLAKLLQRSGTNKTLSRLFKALPGGGETGVRSRCSRAHFVVPWGIAGVRLQARCGIQRHYVTSSQKTVDGVTSESSLWMLNQL